MSRLVQSVMFFVTCLVSLRSALDPSDTVVWNGRKLYLFKKKMNFYEAFSHCESLSLQLFTLRSEEEVNGALMKFDEQRDNQLQNYWTGVYKLESGWKYLSNGQDIPKSLLSKIVINSDDHQCLFKVQNIFWTSSCEDIDDVVCESREDTSLDDIEKYCGVDNELTSSYLTCKKPLLCET